MKSNYKRLGDYIRQVDVRNKDERVKRLLGVSIDKVFIESIANTVGTDMSVYKIVKRGQFAYGPVTSRNGDKVSIALLTEEECIISSSYTVFEITDAKKLLPEYLNLWFKRPEFDRYARFHSHGSAREIFDWEEMCNVELPVPSIEEQEKIVDAYQKIETRIALKKKINENLESQAFCIFNNYTANAEKNSVLCDMAVITMGTSPEGESFNQDGNGMIFYQGRTDFGFRHPTVRLFTTQPKRFAKKGDVLMSVRAPVGDVNIANTDCAIGRGIASLRPKNCCYSFLYYAMKGLYYELNRFNDDGTVFGSISKDDLFALKIFTVSNDKQIQFEKQVASIDKIISDNENEICNLLNTKSILLSRLTN